VNLFEKQQEKFFKREKIIIFAMWSGNIPHRHFGKESVMLILVV